MYNAVYTVRKNTIHKSFNENASKLAIRLSNICRNFPYENVHIVLYELGIRQDNQGSRTRFNATVEKFN